ncbi:hypothetical protein MML48_2g00017655 [Holotrichia oblita]|uniref:Uncharacterized protein n=1 Tax=Holotrichia oblita TaxID=644536 RepID=A0ACB9TMJ5_HOLOL|nr:hypothetical protein MML48_2g00017655 [Holotrichia oblita]
MATRTPTKINRTIESKYSVIPLPQSPSQTSINLTGLPRVAKDIAADVYNTIQKWNDSHIQGAALVKKIINLKCDSKKKYPEGLEKLIEELEEIVHRLSLQANSLTFLSKQISSLSRLHRQQRLFATLSAEELSNLVNTVAKAYQLELKVLLIISFRVFDNCNNFRYFRVIPAAEFLKEFASDRRHMKRPDGSWIKPPPNYPPISTSMALTEGAGEGESSLSAILVEVLNIK